MTTTTLDKRAEEITSLVADLFDIGAIYRQDDRLMTSLTYRFEKKRSVELLKDRLRYGGYTYTMDERDDMLLLSLEARRRLRIPRLNIFLFILTLGSVYFISLYWRCYIYYLQFAQDGGDPLKLAFDQTLVELQRGTNLEFTIVLIGILFCHEMGHFIAGRRRHIIISWPYFLPGFSLIGTFGAVIKSKSPFWNRRDLLEVGAAGPIAGWIVTLIVLVWGLSRTEAVPISELAPPDMPFQLWGESILMRSLTLLLAGPAPETWVYRLSEAAFAGWIGLLVTAINMLPIGQLDGGHVLYGLTQKKQHLLGKIALGVLVVLGFQSTMWWFFAALGLIFGVKHPPTLSDHTRPPVHARIMGIAALIILLLSFTPVPFRG